MMMRYKSRVSLALTVSVYGLLVLIAFALIWKYPAAAVLLPIYLIYGAVCLGLYSYVKRKCDGNGTHSIYRTGKDDAAERDRCACEKEKPLLISVRCLLLAVVTDCFGLAAEEDNYFFFDILCSVDGIAMFADLAAKVRAAAAILRERADQTTARWKRYAQLSLHLPGRRSHEKSLCNGMRLKKVPKLFRSPALYITLYIVLGAFLPFVYQPTVSGSTAENVEDTTFYSDESSGERARVLSQNREALEERIRLISQAEEEIILSTFEFDADTSGKMMMSALMEAAGRGVNVYILVDGFSYLKAMWGNPYFLALAQTDNVEIRVYNPIRPWKPWSFMGRMHDKYLIVDDLAYILGGRNTYDYFLGDQEGHKNYDWDVLVYSADAGEAASMEQVRDYFASVWELSVCRTLADNHFWEKLPSVVSAREELWEVYETMAAEHRDWLLSEDYESETVPVSHIELVSNPTHIYAKEPVVYYTITELMKQAEDEVVFHTPYIICNDWMLDCLEEICQEVDSVTMMTNSVANNGNPFGASDYVLNKEEILETGVQILEYDGGTSYHGKCFVIDDRLSGIGSFNWDMRSAYVDTELMLVIDSEELNAQLRAEMQNYEEDALTVIDIDTSAAPEGKTAQEVSDGKNRLLKLLEFFNWGRFIM